MSTYTVIIASGLEPVRNHIRQFLEGMEDIEIIGEASNSLEVLELIHAFNPDLLIITWNSPGLIGPRIASLLESVGNPIDLLFWGVGKEVTQVSPRTNPNVKGYLPEDTDRETLHRMIQEILTHPSRYAH